MYSPYAVAGYLPVAPELIQTHLLQLLAAGEAVLPVHGTDTFVLWRKSLLDPAWSPVPEAGARKIVMLSRFVALPVSLILDCRGPRLRDHACRLCGGALRAVDALAGQRLLQEQHGSLAGQDR